MNYKQPSSAFLINAAKITRLENPFFYNTKVLQKFFISLIILLKQTQLYYGIVLNPKT